jgi:malonyl CoA-acyl carrier protein transacylase
MRRHFSTLKSKILYCFPGQGSQYPGMCKDWLQDREFGEIAKKFLIDRANSALGESLALEILNLMQSDPSQGHLLTSTEYAQPAIFMHTVTALESYYAKYSRESAPAYLIGHSVGEFAALYAAGILDYESALYLVVRKYIIEYIEFLLEEKRRIDEESMRRRSNVCFISFEID